MAGRRRRRIVHFVAAPLQSGGTGAVEPEQTGEHLVTRDSSASSIIPKTRSEAIAQELRRLIIAGDLAPGTRLRQTEIADRFAVSTTPVREAFTALAREGLVRQDAHRGVVVFSPSAEELGEIYEIRAILEPFATELAATQLTDESLEELSRIVAEMHHAEAVEYARLNAEFHARIYEGAGRARLVDIITAQREASASYLGLTVRHYDAAYRAQAQAEHEQILAALKARTPKSAAKAVRLHLRHNEQHVAALVAKHG